MSYWNSPFLGDMLVFDSFRGCTFSEHGVLLSSNIRWPKCLKPLAKNANAFFFNSALGKFNKGSNEIVESVGSNENQSLILLNFLRSQSER